MTSEEYGQYIDDFELGADVMPGESLTEYIERRRREFESKADGGSIGIEVLFKPKRQNFFMGGPALEGQALSIYTSMKDYGATDQAIADRLSSLGLYDPNASDGSTPPDSGDNIIGSQINQGGGGGITELQKTFTPGAQPKGPKFDPNINPAAFLTGKGRLDPMGSDVDYFNTLPGSQKFNFGFKTSDIPGQPGYQAPSKYFQEPSMINKGITAVKDFFGKFSQPKVQGTLGDRLQKQSEMMTIPSLAGAFAKLRSPFNPQSPTYNAALPMQLNFLEATTGKKITGTSDDLKVTEGLGMIGRDPTSGLLKYGPGSVLAGKNVISGFGSNDYETALNKYLTRMQTYTNPTKFQLAKIQQAKDELAALQAKKEQEYIDSGKQAEVKALQKEIESGKYSGGSAFAQANQAAVGGGNTATNAQGQTAAQATAAGTGTAQGYSQHYARGGLATMFTRRR